MNANDCLMLRLVILSLCVTHVTPLSALQTHSHLGSTNLCAHGKLLPEFYVLGAKNSATSTLAADLNARGVWNAPHGPPDSPKEWMYLQTHFWHYPERTDQVAYEIWFAQLADCPSSTRHVVADYSVMSMTLTSLPSEVGEFDPMAFDKWGPGLETQNGPKLLRFFYSAHSERVKFIFMLREPLSRMQSEWYHTLHLDNCYGCFTKSEYKDLPGTPLIVSNFTAALKLNVEMLQRSPPQITDWVWKSIYAPMIESWTTVWPARQFGVIPYKLYLTNTRMISHELSMRLDFPMEPWNVPTHQNQHEHPKLEDETTPEITEGYYNFFDAQNAKLVQVLAKKQLEGLWLAGYTGASGSETEVKTWLEAIW